MAQAKENNPAPRAKAPAAPKAAAANGTAPAGEKRTRPTTRRPYYCLLYTSDAADEL